MTAQQQSHIRHSCLRLMPVMEECGTLLISRLFEIAPYLRSVFRGDPGTHGMTAMLTVVTVVRSMEYPAQHAVLLQDLSCSARSAGIVPSHYDIFASAFLWTIERMLGAEYSDEVRDAWVALYAETVSVMRTSVTASAV